jgi:hypothetical protein
MLPLLQGSFGQQLAQQLDPSIQPPAPRQAPAASTPPVPETAERQGPAVSVGQPGPAPGAGRVQHRKAKRNHESNGPTAAIPIQGNGDPQAYLRRLLELSRQLLGASPPAASGDRDRQIERSAPTAIAPDWTGDPDPLWQT